MYRAFCATQNFLFLSNPGTAFNACKAGTLRNNLMKKTITIVSLVILNLSFAQTVKEADTLEVWTLFSSGNFVNENAERIVAKKWPFKIKGIAGDVFTEEVADSVEIHNSSIWKYLESNGYSDAKKKFESDMRLEITQIKKAVEMADSEPMVAELLGTLREKKRQNYTELKKLSPEKYEFTLYSFDVSDLDKGQSFEMKFIADLSTSTILFE